MPNIIKYNLSTSPNSIQSGNFNVAVNNTPTNLTGFYNGICPIIGGYTIYINKVSNGPSIYIPKNDSDLIQIVKQLGGNVSTAQDALVWINSQSNMTVLNNNYPSIVTSGLVVNLDAGFVSSYPKTGTTWKDLSGSGNNGGLINGPTYSSDGGGSFIFDGVDDACNIPIPNASSYSTITICGFIKWLSFGSDMFLGMTTYDVWTAGNCLGYNNGNGNVVGINAATVTSLGLLGNWKHYTFVMNSSGLLSTNKIYINGVSVGPLTAVVGGDSGAPGFATNLKLCDWNNGGYYGNLQYGNLMTYNRELTPSEILQNYYAGLQRFIPTDGLVLSLDAQNTNLYATSPTTAYDVSGNNNNGAMLNGVQYIGGGNGSWSFDGTDDYISIPYSSTFDFSLGQTIILWLKPGTGALSQRRNPYNQAYGGSGTITHEPGGGFSYFFGTNGGNGEPYAYFGSSFTVVENEQAFIAVTRNQTTNTCNFYKNGALTNTGTAGGYATTNNGSSPIQIGYGYTGWVFIGIIGQVQIYNRALSATEITTIYNATKTRYGL